MLIKDVSPDQATRSSNFRTIIPAADTYDGIAFFMAGQINPNAFTNFEKIQITGGRARVRVQWQGESSVGGYNFMSKDVEGIASLEAWILWRRFVEDENVQIETLPTKNIPLCYSPYDVKNIGRMYKIGKKRYKFQLSQGMNDPDKYRKDITIKIPKMEMSLRQSQKLMGMPFIFIVMTGYRRNNTTHLMDKWENIDVRSESIIHYRGLTKKS